MSIQLQQHYLPHFIKNYVDMIFLKEFHMGMLRQIVLCL